MSDDLRATQTGRPKRRGPSPAKTAATRSALIVAALSEFMEKGFAATRMSDVAARANLAKGTTYLHFRDKEGLFAEGLREVIRGATAGRPLGRPRPDEPTRDFLLRVVPPVLRGLQASGRFRVLQLIAAEGQRFPELADIYRDVAIEPMLRLVRLYATRAERRGELKPGVLSHQPILMVAPVVVSALWNGLFARGEPIDIASVFESYVELMFD